MLWVILNKSWKQHSMKQQLSGHLPPISNIIQDEQDMHDTAYIYNITHKCWNSIILNILQGSRCSLVSYQEHLFLHGLQWVYSKPHQMRWENIKLRRAILLLLHLFTITFTCFFFIFYIFLQTYRLQCKTLYHQILNSILISSHKSSFISLLNKCLSNISPHCPHIYSKFTI